MTALPLKSLAAALCLSLASLGASAQQLILTPSNVIGASGSFSSSFLAGLIFNQQTGTVSDVRGNYWLNPDNTGSNPVFITIDLGAAYPIDSISLFNTHNDSFYDRGTGNFTLRAGNSVTNLGAGNFRLSGSTTTLVSGALALVAAEIPSEVVFDVTDQAFYRYLSFEPSSTATLFNAASPTAYGLNEMRVVVSAVPEASTSAMMLAGVAVVGWLAARRRSRPG
jgi:hypothetical protein